MIQPSILNSLRVAVSFLSNVHFSSLTVSSLMIYRLEHWRWNRAMSKKKRARPSFLFPLMCMSKSSFRPAPSARYFLLFGWPFDERCLPPWLNTPSRKKKEPVLCEKSCDGGPLVVAQRKIFSPFKPPSTIATVNIRKHPVSMYGAQLFYPDDYNALLFYSTPEMNCARCAQ